MSASTRPTTGPVELDRAMQQLAAISGALRKSYAELERRAERVEDELSRANDELARQVAERDALLEALPTGVVVRSEDGTVVRVNSAAAAILGGEVHALVGRRDHAGLVGPAACGEPHEYEHPDGARLVVASRSAPIRSTDGAPAGSVEILDDQTELRRLSAELHRMDKMAALGTMAGGIAHEIRNPMNAIRGFAELLGRHAGEDEQQARWARLITQGVDEVDAIIDSMLTFAAPDRLRTEVVDARELVQSAVGAAFHHGREGARERWTLREDVPDVRFRADRMKLRQALRNLVANAADVQPDGGPIDVALRVEGEELVLRVADGGPGIPKGLEQKLVDPFFTTRAEGTGLGLALVHTIARLHGGSFEIGSRAAPDKGALAVLRIPFSPISEH